jgi:hypothetical protein
MLKRNLVTALVIAASTMVGQTALAHGGAKPQHGGVVQVANDIGFELVAEADGATLYLQDHGKPMASAGLAGKLTVLVGSQKVEAELKPAGDNKLRASGVRLSPGAKVVAVVNSASGKATTVRFTIK